MGKYGAGNEITDTAMTKGKRNENSQPEVK
jgi:hypothetical protein